MSNLEYKNLIQFVKAGKEEKAEKKENTVETNHNGENVKAFYENLIRSDSGEIDTGTKTARSNRNTCVPYDKPFEDASPKRRKLDSKKTSVEYVPYTSKGKIRVKETATKEGQNCDTENKFIIRLGNEFLRYAEQGNLSEIKKLAEQVDLNHTDSYGWTPLMCACVAGHVDTIEYLLKCGADKEVRNNQGKTALQLAEDMGATLVVDLIKNLYSRHKKERRKERFDKNDKTISEKAYCEICNSEYVKTSEKDKTHFSSTVHLFNLKLKPKPDPFMISETNVGYKLMRQSGWDGEKGLGPEGQGHKYPIKTTLKTDRSCLGSTHHKDKSKITHYGPNDPGAVKAYQKKSQRVMSARTVSRRERLRKERKAKVWERNLRMEMNMD